MQRPLPTAAPFVLDRRPTPPRPVVLGLAALVALFALALAPRPARAQSRVGEGAARALDKKAMEDDYLNTDFDKATDKLNQAIAKCGTDKCGVPLRAQLKRDLAAVQSAAGHRDAALAAMIDALHIDAGLQLDANYKTKELEAVFTQAKREAKSGGGGGAAPAAGDFTHIAVTEQQVRTPIPIYVEYTGSETLKRVIIKYKAVGMTEWKSLELKSIGNNGFGANTACADSQLGDFNYYVQGFNEQNDPVASGGDRTTPYRVVIKSEAMGDPPHLPGQSPPTQCADKGDCPPDFPGCNKKNDTPTPAADDPSLKGEGDACEEDNECKSGTCKSEKCTAPPEDTSGAFPHRKRFWIGAWGSLDLSLLSGASDVCRISPMTAVPLNSAGYYCTQNGIDYPVRTAAGPTQATNIVPGSADTVGGGMTPGNVRVGVSFDYAITANQMAGVRLGYIINTYPGSAAPHFAPFHGEARYSYVFGDSPIGKSGIHPFILGGAGVGAFDAAVSVAVYENPYTLPAGVTGPVCNAPPGGRCVASVSAWQTAGPFFFETGGGARWEFVPGFAALVDLKLVFATGGSSGFKFIPTPEAGVQYGF